MAYDKYTWQTGEVITQEKLNHMEDGIEDAYELPSVTETDNGKVLGVENGVWSVVNGGGDAGYECTEEVEELFEETVTTVELGGANRATLAFSDHINAQALLVTFDGVEYECPHFGTGNISIYGNGIGGDWAEFPFTIASRADQNSIITQYAGNHNVSVKEVYYNATSVSPCLKQIIEDTSDEIVSDRLEALDVPTIEFRSEERNLDITPNGSNQISFTLAGALIGICSIDPIVVTDGDSTAFLESVVTADDTVRLTYTHDKKTDSTITTVVRIYYSYLASGLS